MASSSSTLFNATKTVVIKTNNRCNLHCTHCTHCYDEFNQIKERPSLNKEMYGKIHNKLIAYSQDNGIDHLNLIWHGGESMLMGLNFYKEIISLQQDCGLSFYNLMQTNGT